MEVEEGLVVRGRVEIDMRQPFKSVKEAVMLFGEKVLAGEVYAANKLKEMENKEKEKNQYQTRVAVVATQLEETKQTLEKAKEEGKFMAYYLTSLKQELEETRSELKQLKSRREAPYPKQYSPVNPEIEEIKFIENSTKVEAKPETEESDHDHEDDDDEYVRFEKKRSVKFASPPLLTKVIVCEEIEARKMQETSPSSLKKKAKKKPLIPILGIFSRKKGSQEASQSPRTPKTKAIK